MRRADLQQSSPEKIVRTRFYSRVGRLGSSSDESGGVVREMLAVRRMSEVGPAQRGINRGLKTMALRKKAGIIVKVNLGYNVSGCCLPSSPSSLVFTVALCAVSEVGGEGLRVRV